MNKVTKEHFARLYPQFEQEKKSEISNENKEAVCLVDNYSFVANNRRYMGIPSWNYENRFSKTVNTTGDVILPLSNKDSSGYVSINRDFEPQKSGVVTVVTDMTIKAAENGARLYLTSSEKENVFEIFTRDGYFWCRTDAEYKSEIKADDGKHHFKIELDLDGKTVLYAVDGVVAGKHALGKFDDVSKVYISTTKGFENLEILPHHMYIHANYAVDEIFPTAVYPYDWEKSEAYPVFSKADRYGTYALKFDKNTCARKNFKTLNGKIVLEHYFLMPHSADVLTVRFSDALTVKVTGETISCKELNHSFKHNVWQCVHVEADTDKNEGVIFVNGKKRAVVKLDDTAFSYISFDFEKNSEDGYLLIDDVRVYNIYDYEDYCPKPVPAQSEDYNLIMSVCSLWHEGSHFGWDCISPFDECTPLMGYYDEGIPEGADWETKFMVEHGVKALQYCWFATNPTDFSEPMKRPAMDWQQHYGYFYGKYSDMLKFCFMWENARFNDSKMTLDEFKHYIWDYWVEWYFRDERYLTVDNKPVIHLYIIDCFINTFGSIKEAKKVMDFMREDIKNYGFDGVVLLANITATAKKNIYEKINLLGFDGVCKYGWKQGSYDADYINEQNEKLLDDIHGINSDMFLVPTACTGWNIVGWKDERSPLMDKKEHLRLLNYYKNIIDGQTGNYGMMYMSTWNEYGEGHWLAPSGLCGFDYADAWREVFTDAQKAHTDITPTANQMSRICHLYNDKRTPIRSWHIEEPKPADFEMDVLYTLDLNADNWNFENCERLLSDNGEIKVESTDRDPKCIYKENLDLDISEADYLHIKIKSSVDERLVFLFTTPEQEDMAFCRENHVESRIVIPNEYVDYYFPVKELASRGDLRIKNIRIDPADFSGVMSEIKAVEFVKIKKDENKFDIVVDGVKLDVPVWYKNVLDGEYYVAANVKTGILSSLNIYHEWNRFEGKLYLNTSTDTEFTFTVGSDVCLVDGKEMKLKKAFCTYDKLPVVPLGFLLEKSGIGCSISDGKVNVHVRSTM